MEKENLRDKALKRYAELMIQKIKEVDASDWQKPWFGTSFPVKPKTSMAEGIIISTKYFFHLFVKKKNTRHLYLLHSTKPKK